MDVKALTDSVNAKRTMISNDFARFWETVRFPGAHLLSALAPGRRKVTFSNGFQAFQAKKNIAMFFWPVVSGSS